MLVELTKLNAALRNANCHLDLMIAERDALKTALEKIANYQNRGPVATAQLVALANAALNAVYPKEAA